MENVVAPRRVYDNKKTRVLVTVAGSRHQQQGHPQRDAHRSTAAPSRASPSRFPRTAAPPSNFCRSTCRTAATKARSRSIRPTPCPPTTPSTSPSNAPTPATPSSCTTADDTRGLLYFKAALEASGQSAFEIDPASAEQTANLSPSKYAFVVLSDVGALPAAFENELKTYVRGGGSVLIALGRMSVARMKVPVSDEHIEAARYSGREGERFQTVAWLDPSHPSIVKDDRWDDVKFYQAIRVAPGNARVVAKLTDQTPLLMDQQVGSGHIMVFASTFDNVANDFPRHPSFVPFIEQTARYLGPPRCRAFQRARWVPSPNCAIPRRAAPPWTWWTPRASVCFRSQRPPRRRTFSSPRRVSTTSGGPTAATNWWR